MVPGVRLRSWIAISAAVAGLTLGFIDRAVDADLAAWSGILWLAAILLGISLLPFWKRVLPDVPDMPGLFTKPGPGQRWCVHCGTPADGREACGVCGHTPKPPRPKKEKPAKAEADSQ